ncbi:bifunctional GNAT family N-acetyltransferase/nucleoside triphosphate pyrophosphohydrolase family protein [Actinomyces vulturis]|uniref:bifunctional GNAT family N-acetyltransferase/nucleoside triphosphate pyrophosphohydrolase family protein n=1 Tax=Actinomyces vulturis TaxID=1857645 RepID=UPI00082BF143|nr:bifunctional GNAT family N-acetyltransferase/nucleoside triphosphate pyrophosphohydrolase family protein [Actinomyces vulturis]
MEPCVITVENHDEYLITLSAPTMQDATAITEACQDPAIQRWTTVPSPYTRDDATAFITNVVEPGWENSTLLTFAIRVGSLENAALAGMCSLELTPTAVSDDAAPASSRARGLSGHEGPIACLGVWMAPQYRDQGIAYTALTALIDWAFDTQGPLNASALHWDLYVDQGVPNWDSWRLAWQLGFTKEGAVRRRSVAHGFPQDHWICTLLPTDKRTPSAPWDGPGRGHTTGESTPIVTQEPIGLREGDNPEAMVRTFHRTYGLPIVEDGPNVDRDRVHMRMGLIAEEFAELVGAVYGTQARELMENAYSKVLDADDHSRDTVETADALADLVYVIYGMALEMGIDLAAVLTEVQRSNLSKLGTDGKPIYREDGKVLKGPYYFRPDVASMLGLLSGE